MATASTQPVPVPAETWPTPPPIDYEKFVTEDDKPVDTHLLRTPAQPVDDHADRFLAGSRRRPVFPCPYRCRPVLCRKQAPLRARRAAEPDVSPPQNADLSRKENHSYYVWRYGKPPDALVEVVSNNEGGELTTKLKGYAKLRATYYIVWDPLLILGDKPLHCFALQEGKYKTCDPWFPEIGLGVKTWDGTYGAMPAKFLRWCDHDGNLIPTGAERAEQEKQRADGLAEKLRRGGHRPGHSMMLTPTTSDLAPRHPTAAGDRFGSTIPSKVRIAWPNRWASNRPSHLGECPSRDGLVFLARDQTAGRGQYGRSWLAPAGSSVLMSVAAVSAAGVAPARRLEPRGRAVSVCGYRAPPRQPRRHHQMAQRVLVRGKKICGILIEAAHHRPCRFSARNPPSASDSTSRSGGRDVPTGPACPWRPSLASLSGLSFAFEDVAQELIRRLDDHYHRLLGGDFHHARRKIGNDASIY